MRARRFLFNDSNGLHVQGEGAVLCLIQDGGNAARVRQGNLTIEQIAKKLLNKALHIT